MWNASSEMLDDLNALLAAHRRRADTTEQFAEFMAKHGDFFPENPQTVDELIDVLAARSAAAQRMMQSLSPEQRAELAELSQQAFGESAARVSRSSQLDAATAESAAGGGLVRVRAVPR